MLPGADTAQARREAATTLLYLLQRANTQASGWLRAVQAEGRLIEEGDETDLIRFSDEETALVLFLLDERSIGSLLRVLNLILSSAQVQANEAMQRNMI